MSNFVDQQSRLAKQSEWLQIFLEHLRERGVDNHVAYDEGYKFQSVDTFQQYFDLEATDLAGNLDLAIENNNLVTASMYFPRKMLLLYAQQFPEETRDILNNLFDESREISERIDSTKNAFEDLEVQRAKNLGEQSANTYIGLRFISLLLGYRYPNKYNALKPAEWKVFARFINPSFSIPHKTPPGKQYEIYNEYIEPLRQFLQNRPEVKELRNQLTYGIDFKDVEMRWATQDVIFVTARALADKRASETVPKEAKESPVEQFVQVESITNEDVDTGFMAYEAHLEEYVIKNWDNINFGEKLNIYYDDDGTTGQQYTTDVGIIDILALDEHGDFVVIELKRAEYGYRVVGQVLNYMGWVQDKLAQESQKVRGMVIVGKADKTLLAAIRPVSDKISLKEYRIKMYLDDPKI